MEKRFFNVNADDEGILVLEDNPTASDSKEYIAMSGKLYILNINGQEKEIGKDRISARELKEKFHWPPNCWVTVTRRWGGEPDILNEDDEIVLGEVETVSISSPHKRGHNAELRRLHGRLAMETAFLSRMETYGNVSFRIAEDGSEAFVFVEMLQIGLQWNMPVVDIFIKIPAYSPGYPELKLDNFFVSKDLRTWDGEKPVNLWIDGEFDWLDKSFLEQGYAQFSFHHEAWNPIYDTFQQEFTNGDSLVSYLAAISDMFHQPAQVRW